MRVPFVGPTYSLRSSNVSAQRCINLYPEANEAQNGKEGDVASLQSTPGARLHVSFDAALESGGYKGIHVTRAGVFFGMVGRYVIKRLKNGDVLHADGATLVPVADRAEHIPAHMADNGVSAYIISGGTALITTVDPTTTAQTLTAAALGFTPLRVDYLDGYFLFPEVNSGRFYISALNGITVNLLDVGNSEGSPDNIVGAAVRGREYWLFNESTTEVFYNSGAADFPFVRLEGGFIEVGLAAAESLVKLGGTLFWISKDENGAGMVVQNDGYGYNRISTHSIEQLLGKSSDISLARAVGYQKEGHFFYCLNAPGVETTLCYDALTREWHERAELDQFGGLVQEEFNNYCLFQSAILRTRPGSTSLFTTENDIPTVLGSAVPRIRSAPSISKNLKRVQHNSFQLDMETGVGLPGTDPQVLLRWSDDGGHTWTDYAAASIGRVGEYGTRAIWHRLGASRDRVYEVKIVEPVRVTILGADLDAVGLSS